MSAITACAQYRPFEKYNFDEGDYTLIGVFVHHKDHAVQKKVGEFYTSDIEVLKAIQKTWNFPRKQAMHACGYHYNILLLNNGEKVESLSINLECNEIITEKGSRYFDPSVMTNISNRVNKLITQSDEFASIQEAREYWQRIKQDENFVYALRPEWLDFEGRFRFRVQCPEGITDCYMSGRDEAVLESVRKKISTTYPSEKFEIRTSGGTSDGEAFIEIKCDKSLESKFDVYDRWNKDAFGRWAPFHLALRSYWKNTKTSSTSR